jgi:1-acyl-sn-glycerol-3-phosphate acyltransferase
MDKPRAEQVRPEITRLARLSLWRMLYRWFVVKFIRFVVLLLTRTHASGLENIPRTGAALIVSNHLGDADLVVGLAASPVMIETFAKAELYDYPLLGKLLNWYGVIWIHRGQPDRRALRAALDGLQEGRLVSIAPEGRESLTGALEEGVGGAAYLALKAGVPVLPVTFTGTENARVYSNLRNLRRTEITVTVGPLFRLEVSSDRAQAIEQGTLQIMKTLAAQLPIEYRGIYQEKEDNHGS